MFAIHLRQIYRTCDKVFIRNLRNPRFKQKGANPGLDNRLKAFQEDGFKVKEEELEEFVEGSESDFYKVGEAYNEHMNETLIGKYEMRHRIIKEKYFKENMPNLLTWSEKEQIRHLATEEPDDWSPEKIAESFPVTIPVVKKLLKYTWKPATEERIARHDASVMRNWKELKDGSLNIPEDLRKHFLKFSSRTIPPLNKKSIKVDLTLEAKIGEFERIVQRCAAKEGSKQSSEEKSVATLNNSDFSNESNDKPTKAKVKKDPKMITLDELTTKIKQRLDKGNNVDMGDKIIVDTIKSSKIVKTSEDVTNEIELYKEDNTLVEYKEREHDAKDVMNYPERIRIPRKAYKKGATYKVNDCYYDHDGKFLYRVLGMSN